MATPGPTISINLSTAEGLLRLGDLKKAAAAALKDIREIEKAAAKAEAQGRKLDASTINRLQRAERVYDTANSKLDAAEERSGAKAAANTGRTSYEFRKWQSQFADHGSGGMGRHMGMLMGGGLSIEGVASSLSQIAGLGVAGKLIKEVLDIPEAMEKIQSKIRDYERSEKGTTTYLSPLERLRNRQKVEGEIIGEIPVVGGILGRGAGIGLRVRQLMAGEENVDNVDLRVKNTESLRRLGLGGTMKEEELSKSQKVSTFSRKYAELMGNLDPNRVELEKNIAAATKLLEAGMAEAAKGNIVGDQARQGFGGARDFFNRANQLLPGISPQDASATYQAIEQGRIADRNFARSQMARAGPRTGD